MMNILSLYLKRIITTGDLKIRFPGAKIEKFGDGTEPAIAVAITKKASLAKLTVYPELYLGEAYMNGDLIIEQGDIREFVRLIAKNIGWDEYNSFNIVHYFRWLTQQNNQNKARRNVAHHYDLSNDFYRLFLDEDMFYSCAYFTDKNMTLDQAQMAKKKLIASKLLLNSGLKVLDIGCGWGGMAKYLAQEYNVSVEGVTLSEQQFKFATASIKANELDDLVNYRLEDYRDVKGQFDRIVSVGMFEHVGVPYYNIFFNCLRHNLKPDGVALIHTIGRASVKGVTNSWIRKYIFPGGYIPALSEITTAVEKNQLYITDIEVLRLHYAETLLHWWQNTIANRDRIIDMYDERFYRMWLFYLAVSEMSFRYRGMVVFQLQLSRDQNAVPITRDYLFKLQ